MGLRRLAVQCIAADTWPTLSSTRGIIIHGWMVARRWCVKDEDEIQVINSQF